MTQIKEALTDFNPWWKQEFNIGFKDREIYKKIQKFLILPQIIAFTGLRRVGKTTIMLKIIEDKINKGFNSKNIIYFSFDQFRESKIRGILSEYESSMKKDLRNEKYLLLLDEIQKADDWENQIKTIYDTFRNVKIIISGSESLFIRKKSKETLAGRMFEFKVETLSFKEFLSFKGINFSQIDIYRKELSLLLDEYILTLGFPELVGVKDKDIIKKYVNESIVEKVIFRDIPTLLGIKDITIIETLLNIFIEEPCQLIEISKLAQELKISRQTLSSYLSYLEQSFLLKKLYNYSKSKRKSERKLKKYYPTIISADLLFKEDELSKSKIFEWMLVIQTNAKFFWRDPYKNEVDIVIADKKPIPIEIKYGKIETQGILAFMKKFGVNEGFIISKDKEETLKINGKNIFIVPAFKYLLENIYKV